MSDDSNHPAGDNGPTQKLERPSFEDFDEQEGTQEVDASEIELIEDSAIEPIEPPDATLERESNADSPADSTQVLERGRLQQAAQQDENVGQQNPEPSYNGPKRTEKMSAVVDDTTTSVVMDTPDAVEDTTSAYEVPEELLREASAAHEAVDPDQRKTTQPMEPVHEQTVEFDGSVDQWAEVDDDGVIRCIATVDDEGRLLVPQQLIGEVLDSGMRLILQAQPMSIDD